MGSHVRAHGSGLRALMVARLWKKYAARRKVKALSVVSSPKSSKKLIVSDRLSMGEDVK